MAPIPQISYEPAPVETERLILRVPRLTDLAASAAMWADPAVTRYIGPRAHPSVHDGDFRLESGLRAGREILTARPRPTAVVAANDLMALGVMKASRAEGLSIPRDLSVVGFDDIAFASLADPPLSTVCLPRDALARGATAALINSLDESSPVVTPGMVPTYFVARASTGPAPK